MSEYTFEMVPQHVGRIAELRQSIGQKLDGVTIPSTPTGKFNKEYLNIEELCEYLPSHPAQRTVYEWCRKNLIYYKNGKRSIFKKAEIDKWLIRTRVKDYTELKGKALHYVYESPARGKKR